MLGGKHEKDAKKDAPDSLKCADPWSGVLEHLEKGGLPPPTPSALGPSPPTPRPNRRKNTLYVYWGLTLAHGDQILRRGAPGSLWGQLSILKALGPLPPNPRPNRLKHTLYVYWFHTLALGDQILQRWAWVHFG